MVARHSETNGAVFQDSCVEFFFSCEDNHYINCETNCRGVSLIQRWQVEPREGGEVSSERIGSIRRTASLKELPLDAEITEPVTWQLTLSIPIAFVMDLCGPGARAPAPGVEWRANFYKHRHNSNTRDLPERHGHYARIGATQVR